MSRQSLSAVLLGFVMLIILLVCVYSVASTPENKVYLSPEDLTINGTAAVEFWVDAEEEFQGGQLGLTYDPNCLFISNWERNSASFFMGGWDSSVEGKVWLTVLAESPLAGNYKIGSLTLSCISGEACVSTLNFSAQSALFDQAGDEISAQWVNGTVTCMYVDRTFNTGPGTYPSIPGIYYGTIQPTHTITVSKLYTYPCPGTGGHTEYARIGNVSVEVNGTWNGYAEDWHTITFNNSLVLEAGQTYTYTIHTQSYPQMHHIPSVLTANGWINCSSFVDANGQVYTDRIPAIKLS